MSEAKLDDLVAAIKVDSVGQGDTVFLTLPAGMLPAEYEAFGKRFKKSVDEIRARADFFPLCYILPPGVKVAVARRDYTETVTITGDVKVSGDLAHAGDHLRDERKPEDGFPYG
jgi:hypothetical protein